MNAARRRRSVNSRGDWVFVVPYALVLIAFGLAPVAYALFTSFRVTPVAVFGSAEPYFSLTKNYADVLRDYRLLPALGNVGLFLLIWLPAMLIVVLVVALVMDAKRTRLGALTRFVAYVPGAVTGAAAALLWLFMFSPAVSPFGPLLRMFTSDEVILSDSTLPWILAVLSIAAGAGGWIVVLYGALVSVSPEVVEAARIDGAGAWQLVRRIKLPMVRNYLVFILIVSVANGFQVFVEPQVMSVGAPNQVSSTWSVNQLVYAYVTQSVDFGKASALSMMLLVVCVVVAVVIITKTRFYDMGRRR